MKKVPFLILITIFFASCHKDIKKIIIDNPTLNERINDLVEIPLDEVGISDFSNLVLIDDMGNKVSYQITPTHFIFLVSDIRGGMQTIYKIQKGKPAEMSPKVSARYVPERKDDFAWENEYAAYRMYGPALANEYPSNGVDLWSKSVDELIVDSFYYRDLTLGLPYHINYGKGLDGYKVAHTLGCGGICPIDNDHLCIGNQYDSCQLDFAGPLQAKFTLFYSDHSISITVSSEQALCKAEYIPIIIDSISGKLLDSINLATGVYLHDSIGNIQLCIPGGWLAYAETATSDPTSYEMNGRKDMGRTFSAVYLPNADTISIVDNTLCAIRKYKLSQNHKITYYFGGAWSKGKCKTDAEWFSIIAATTQAIKKPLVCTIQ